MMTMNANKKREQIQMFCMDDLVPKNHLLRVIDKAIDWLSGKFEISEYLERQAAPKIEIENNTPAGRTFSIYQLKNDESTRPFKFEGLDYVKQHNENDAPSLAMYDLVYSGSLPEGKGLDDIFTEFNINHPADFTEHSLSVSDIIAIKFEGEITAHYVDSFGFENLPEFAQAIEDKQQEIDVASHEKYQGATTIQNALIEQMRNLGYEPAKIAGFSDDFLMWTETSTGKEFGVDDWDGVKQFISDKEAARRHEETLDSVKFDNDIDLDREKTIEQLGFKDQAAAPAQPQKNEHERAYGRSTGRS